MDHPPMYGHSDVLMNQSIHRCSNVWHAFQLMATFIRSPKSVRFHFSHINDRTFFLAVQTTFGYYQKSCKTKQFGHTMTGTICPIVLCGPSGSGKSTLMKKLMSEFEGNFGFSVSHTTRVSQCLVYISYSMSRSKEVL